MTVHLTRRDPSKNLSPFYRMLIVPDLFGHWLLLREWGRNGSGGKVRADVFNSPGDALLALQRLTREKVRRGYARLGAQITDQDPADYADVANDLFQGLE